MLINKYIRCRKLRSKSDLPSGLIIYVTSKCNQKCSHCYYSESLNATDDLTLREYENISIQLNQIDSLLIGGGEPFINRDLPRILKFFYDNNCTRTFSIPSNFSLLDRMIDSIDEMIKYCPEAVISVNASFDGMEDTHNSIRGKKNAFSDSMYNCGVIHERYKSNGKVLVTVSSTIMKDNIDELYDLGNYVNNRFRNEIPVSYGLLRGYSSSIKHSLPSIKEIRSLYHNTRCYRKMLSFLRMMIYDALTEIKVSVLTDKKQIVQCRAGEFIGVVYADGSVSSCEMLPSFGSILDKGGLSVVWQSDAAIKQRQSIVNNECYCTHECFIHPSAVYSKNMFIIPYFFLKNIFMNMFYSIKYK